jgi:hypothetical protein
MSGPSIAPLRTFGTLPAEIRIMVYDEVFGSTKVITPMRGFNTALSGDQLLQPEVYIKAPVHTSILATNKTIYTEALDMLYRVKLVRGSITQFTSLLRSATFRDLVRAIEIDDHFVVFQNHPGMQRMLQQLQGLVQNRSTTILSDRFAIAQHNGRSYITVREFATLMHLGEASCVDIGRFQLSGKFGSIHIVHRKLVKMWPNVMDTPEEYDVYADLLGVVHNDISSFPVMQNVPAWAAQTSLRRWVGLYNELICADFNLGAYLESKNAEQRSLLTRFLRSTRGLATSHNGRLLLTYSILMSECRSRNMRLNMLRPGEDPEMLARATDILSLNIAAYFARRDDLRRDSLCLAHWAEADGGMHTLDIMKTHMDSTLGGDLNAHYVSHPVFARHLTETSFIRFRLTRFPPKICEPHTLNPRQIRQFYLLQLALTHTQSFVGRQGPQSMDDWSLHLLKRYLLVDPAVDEREAKRATLHAMRAV